MNHPVKIEDSYESKYIHFYGIKNCPPEEARQLYVVEEYFEWPGHEPKIKLSLISRAPRPYGRNKEVMFTWNRTGFYMAPLIYAEQNGEEFLITSGDCQCISIYNITKNEFKDYVVGGESAYIKGDGFCPIVYSIRDNNLIVEGYFHDEMPQRLIIKNPDYNNLKFDDTEWENTISEY